MFFRTKTSGPRSYLQIVENRWKEGRPRQRVISTLDDSTPWNRVANSTPCWSRAHGWLSPSSSSPLTLSTAHSK